MCPRKELNGMVQGVSVNRRFLVRFQDVCEKDLNLNQLTIVTVENIPVTKEAEVPMIYVIPDETTDMDKGYYHFVCVLQQFNKDLFQPKTSTFSTRPLI